MRPGVPWNVKGIEAEAREMAQLAARRNGVSLGEYLSQLIMTEGRVGTGSHGYPQQQFMPGDGTYGPQPATYARPQPQQAFPQQAFQHPPPQPYQPLNPHQSFPQQHQHQQQQAQPSFESQIRGSEFQVVAHGLRDLADRLEGSERRAQTAIATVNQSVAAMQDRIDAAERVKQLADVAFTSAADALAQSARDQASAFDNLETTVRSVQKRLVDIESGKAEWPGKDAVGRLEGALTQLQKRLVEMESAHKPDSAQKDQFARLEITLNHLQKRLAEMETARMEFPHKDALMRLEASIAEVRHGVVDNEKRSRDDLTQLARFMRELNSRVEQTERGAGGGNVTARIDALEARSASMFDEMRGHLTAMDGRIAQISAKPASPPEALTALQRSVDTLHQRIEQHGGGSMGAIEQTLDTLTTKIEEGERRAADSVSTMSNALKAISTRLDESDKKQAQAITSLTRRFDESERKTSDLVEDTMRSISQRLETSDKKHKDAISGLRLTVDGLVAKAAADAVPDPRTRTSAMHSPLSATTSYAPPPPPEPFPTAAAPALQQQQPMSLDARADDGFSVSALETIMSSPMSSQPSALDVPLELDRFAPEPGDALDTGTKRDDFLTQARRAAQKAAQADAERQQSAKGSKKQQRQAAAATASAYPKEETQKSRIGRLVIVSVACLAVVAGIVALLFTLPGGGDEGVNRPGAGESIGEMLNGQPAAIVPKPGPSAEFAPPSSPDSPMAPGSAVSAEANGLGAPPSPSFTSGTGALPGGQPVDTSIAGLESGAVRGDAKAQFLLALRYSEGRGVEKDETKALSLATKAAEQGYVLAQYRLGAMFERGIGVPKDLAAAKLWYEKAAKGGNRKAMHNLAVLYADGVGIGQSFQAASTWFRQGAEYGLVDSQYNLAILLERGMGVEKNLQEAAKWYAVASTGGDSGATERLETLRKTLSANDIAMALEAAKRFQAKPLDPAANEMPGTP
jgi:localization factor PodJL